MNAIRSLKWFGLALGILFLLMPGPALQAAENNLFNEAQVAFNAGNFDLAMHKIRQLPVVQGVNEDTPLELLCYNIGLASSSREKYPQAEDAFSECIKRFPKGEYTSRAYLGLGRARMLQNAPENKQGAIEALELAATDPKHRFEAGMWLARIYTELEKPEEALVVFRSLTGSDVSTLQQATAAVEVIGLLAELGRLEDLSAYLGNLARQPGVRDAIAWFSTQVLERGDGLVGGHAYESALAIYRSVPPRSEILETQVTALEGMRKDLKRLEARVKAEEGKPITERSDASQLLSRHKPAIEQADTALKAIEEKTDLDAALLRRRGMCLFFLNRYSEALVCFRAIRTKYPEVTDAERAAYGEIHTLYFLRSAEIIERSNDFLVRYPHSENAEVVALLAGETLVKKRDWKGILKYYSKLEKRFPQSKNLDDFSYKQAEALFHVAEFKEAIIRFDQFLKNHPGSPKVEKACYHLAMSYFLNHQNEGAKVATAKYLEKFPNGDYVVDLKRQLGESAPRKATDKGR